MSLYRTVSETNGDFSRKSQIFSTPVYLTSPLKRFSLELGIGAGSQKTRMMVTNGNLATGWIRSLMISSAVWIQSTNVSDRQTGRQTDIGRQQRPRYA